MVALGHLVRIRLEAADKKVILISTLMIQHKCKDEWVLWKLVGIFLSLVTNVLTVLTL